MRKKSQCRFDTPLLLIAFAVHFLMPARRTLLSHAPSILLFSTLLSNRKAILGVVTPPPCCGSCCGLDLSKLRPCRGSSCGLASFHPPPSSGGGLPPNGVPPRVVPPNGGGLPPSGGGLPLRRHARHGNTTTTTTTGSSHRRCQSHTCNLSSNMLRR